MEKDDKIHDRHVLKRITIIDKTCSCPLYDKIFSWKTDDQSPGTSAKLISLFNSIASTFKDEDKVRRVIFEPTSDNSRKTKSQYNKYTTGLPSLGGRSNASKSTASASRFMMSQTTGSNSNQYNVSNNNNNNNEMEIFIQTIQKCYVAIFIKPCYYIDDLHEPTILKDLGEQFYQTFGNELLSLEPKFQEMSRDQEEARNNASFLKLFQSFQPIIPPDYETRDYTQAQHVAKSNHGEMTQYLPLSTDFSQRITNTSQNFPLSSHETDIALSQTVKPNFFPHEHYSTITNTNTNIISSDGHHDIHHIAPVPKP